ncbi:hypothetical protein CLAFUW4_08499 [Fulvia fulva]|uniref:NTF2-related export protein n=1 Tax=Passalora fulva TaxID=5499 RepID=A0A9Q8LCE7_PASFU|nr:uncharacterized protein CLAFUR5_08601 [Fulvia fulva]KAK4629694.1 hypothetical protein CLAFUR4_08504 [Fulvia fulva]KAK4630803.1 hypothetical protein CLAFUR0_08499 [Fulvia fulva]UJO14872.1 hypothetical protein CLAFUR5_08601 [Fulvia fulva]WPV12124.1 hypothetical protein CLAFUW4_08499 [Fulvia fulva]WPV27921.1 hypothetical protein CLAFUW7_08499 [Fulvia fulva]
MSSPTISAATTFLNTFFTIFDTGNRADLIPFYTPTARLTYEDVTYNNAPDIVTFLVEAPKKIQHKRAKTVLEQVNERGDVLVLVTGVLEFGKRGTRTNFATTFVLHRSEGVDMVGEGEGEEEGEFVIGRQVSSISFEGDEELDLAIE